MQAITQDSILTLINKIYCIADGKENWESVLEIMCQWLPAGKAIIGHRENATLKMALNQVYLPHTIIAGFEEESVTQYHSHFVNIDIWNQLEQQLNPNEQHFSSVTGFKYLGAYAPKALIHKSEHYNDWAKLQNIESYLVLRLLQFGSYHTALTFCFDDRAIDVGELLKTLNLFAPHLQRAAFQTFNANRKFLQINQQNSVFKTLSDHYGLTFEETRVAIAYSQSGDRNQICQELGKSLDTLKFHLKNIYQKLELHHGHRKRHGLQTILQRSGLITSLETVL